jgi:hypothetical protein
MIYWIALALILSASVIAFFELKSFDATQFVRSQTLRFRQGIERVAARRRAWSSFQASAENKFRGLVSEAKSQRLFENLYVDRGKQKPGEPNFVTLGWGPHPTGMIDWTSPPTTLDVEGGCALHFVQGPSGEVVCIIYPFASQLRVPADKYYVYRLFQSPSDITDRKLDDAVRVMFGVAQFSSYARNPGWEDWYWYVKLQVFSSLIKLRHGDWAKLVVDVLKKYVKKKIGTTAMPDASVPNSSGEKIEPSPKKSPEAPNFENQE